MDGEAGHGQIDGDVGDVENRKRDGHEFQEVDHCPQPPTVQTIACRSPEQEAKGQGLPAVCRGLPQDPKQQAQAHQQADPAQQLGIAAEQAPGGTGIADPSQLQQSWQERVPFPCRQSAEGPCLAELIEKQRQAGQEQGKQLAAIGSRILAWGGVVGVHDSINLGEKLVGILDGSMDMSVLDRYTRQRKHVAVNHVKTITERNKKLINERDPEVRKRNHDMLHDTAADPKLAREYILRTSLMKSLDEVAAIQ